MENIQYELDYGSKLDRAVTVSRNYLKDQAKKKGLGTASYDRQEEVTATVRDWLTPFLGKVYEVTDPSGNKVIEPLVAVYPALEQCDVLFSFKSLSGFAKLEDMRPLKEKEEAEIL